MFKAIFFDMDGLLVDSEPYWDKAETEIFGNHGFHNVQPELTKGMKIAEVVSFYNTKYDVNLPEVCIEEIFEKMEWYIKNEAPLMTGVPEVLEVVKRLAVPIAIVSSSPTRLIDAFLTQLAEKPFQFTYSAENEEYGKPHPQVYLSACEKVEVSPESVLTFEDSFNGVLSAKAAKLKCIAVPSAQDRNDPRFTIADTILDSLLECTAGLIAEIEK